MGMDIEQEEIQFLGFFSLFKEASIIISSWKQLFTQIILAFILPLALSFLAQIEISQLLFAQVLHKEYALDDTRAETLNHHVNLNNMLTSEWTAFWVFKIAYLVFCLIFYLLSTSAVVYAVSCIYTSKEISFKVIMIVVPKLWKRLVITFLGNLIMVLIYNTIAFLVFISWEFFIGYASSIGPPILYTLVVCYLMGFAYLGVVWHLANVVTVLEKDYGVQAMLKSKALIKGKVRVAISIFLLLGLCLIGIYVPYERYVVLGECSVWFRIGFGIVCLDLLVVVILLGLVIQTVIYFICKAFHHERIEKSWLADHLEVYQGDSIPLIAKDVELV